MQRGPAGAGMHFVDWQRLNVHKAEENYVPSYEECMNLVVPIIIYFITRNAIGWLLAT